MPSGPAALSVVVATASGDDGNVPDNTHDGELGTRWSAEGDGEWIRWDLGGVHEIGRVRIAFHKGDRRVSTFDLEVSTDDGPPVRVLEGQRSTGATTQLETFDFTAVSGRYVRYIGHGNDDSRWNSLTEVEVWGADAPPPSDDPPPSLLPSGTARVTPYPTPPSLRTSPLFTVFAGAPEQEVFTEQFTKNRTIHLAGFSATAGSVPIRVEVAKPFSAVQISPKSRNLHHTVDGNSIRFTVTKPERLILFVRTGGGDPEPLYLWIDPPEEPPAPGTPKVRRCPPGQHDVGDLELQSGETLYIAGGALVTGRISAAEGASNVKVLGPGILRETPEGEGHTIRMTGCHDVTIEGVHVRDTQEGWSTRFVRCDGVTIRNVKIFSCGIREDGVDPDGSSNLTIDGCLISTGDDCIAIKSLDHGDVSRIRVLDTVLDSYPHGGGGDGVKIGTETRCERMSDILVKGCDVVRAHGENDVGGHSAFSIVHKGGALIQNVRYEDIHVEGDIQHKNFEIILKPGGSVSDVTLKNITWEAEKPVNLIGSKISNVTFEGCRMAGKPLGSGDVHQEKNPTGVKFAP